MTTMARTTTYVRYLLAILAAVGFGLTALPASVSALPNLN